MPEVVVNVNDQCEVTLTEAGARRWNEALAGIPRQVAVSAGAALRVPLWELMNAFGPLCFNGQVHTNMPFVGNVIKIETS